MCVGLGMFVGWVCFSAAGLLERGGKKGAKEKTIEVEVVVRIVLLHTRSSLLLEFGSHIRGMERGRKAIIKLNFFLKRDGFYGGFPVL